MMGNWVQTEQRKPPVGRKIVWIDSSGQEIRGSYQGGAVWFPEGSTMYIYYTPRMWRLAD